MISGTQIVVLGKPGVVLFRVVSKQTVVDVSAAKGASLENDLNQRDFTINAMACALSSGSIIDYCGGLQDLADKGVIAA